MTKTQELIDAGKLIPHETQVDTYWAHIPIKLTAAQIDNGLVELVASDSRGLLHLSPHAIHVLENWSPVEVDEEGNETPKDTTSALNHIIDFFQEMIKYGAQELLRRSADKQARDAAKAQVDAQLQALGL